MTPSLAGEAAGVPNSPRQRGALRRMPPDRSMAFDSPTTSTIRARGAAVIATLLAAVAGSLISAGMARADDAPPTWPTTGDTAAGPGAGIPSAADLAAWQAALAAKARALVHFPPAGTMPAQPQTTTPPQSQTPPQPQTERPSAPVEPPPASAADQPPTAPSETPPPATEAPAPETVTTTAPAAAPEATAPPTGSDPDDAVQPAPASAPAISTDSAPPSTITRIVQPEPETGTPTDETGTPTDESSELPVAEPPALPGPPPASTPFDGAPAPARPLATHRVPSVRNDPVAGVTAVAFPTDLEAEAPAYVTPQRTTALSSRPIPHVGAPAEDSGARAPLGPLPPLPDAPSSPFGLSAAFSGSAGSAGLVLLAILVVLLVVVPPPLVRRIAISVAAWRGHALAAPLPRPG